MARATPRPTSRACASRRRLPTADCSANTRARADSGSAVASRSRRAYSTSCSPSASRCASSTSPTPQVSAGRAERRCDMACPTSATSASTSASRLAKCTNTVPCALPVARAIAAVVAPAKPCSATTRRPASTSWRRVASRWRVRGRGWETPGMSDFIEYLLTELLLIIITTLFVCVHIHANLFASADAFDTVGRERPRRTRRRARDNPEETAMVMEWSTDSVPAAARFDQWREACCEHVYALTPERASRGSAFHGAIARRQLGALDVTDIACDGHVVRRREQDISECPGDTYYIYLQRQGRAWFDQHQRRCVAEAGDIVIADPNLAFSTGTDGAFDFRLWPHVLCVD
eukprot:Opistho-1_new@10293